MLFQLASAHSSASKEAHTCPPAERPRATVKVCTRAPLTAAALFGRHALVLLTTGVEMAVALVDGEVHRLAIVGDLQRAVLVDRRVALGLGLAAEELRRGAADHEGLAIALDVHRLVLRLQVDPVTNELLAFHLGATAHQQCRGQRGAHPLHHRAFSS
ncbi:hypothetical protein XAC2852_950003 [Xanthomonas citri pv. citri]|nr:hypothetical protein XAC2852_950003 [Xanthomonas citri pv. citri]